MEEHIRVDLGNETAIRAICKVKRPFPDGTIFAKVAWIDVKHPKFPVAVVPGSFAQVEFMTKDSNFAQACFGCHSPVANNDIAFTNWAGVP